MVVTIAVVTVVARTVVATPAIVVAMIADDAAAKRDDGGKKHGNKHQTFHRDSFADTGVSPDANLRPNSSRADEQVAVFPTVT
jgi:hypothetical protein